jgi:hypothetical protein
MLYQRRRKTDTALRIYARFCAKLAKKGLIKGAGEGAKDFAERIKITLPQQADEIDRITGVFINLRYGRQPAPQDIKQLKRRVALFNP